MNVARPSNAVLAGGSVVVTVVGMVLGVGLLLFTSLRSVGWYLFLVSFAIWMAAAVAAMLVMWERGYFDV